MSEIFRANLTAWPGLKNTKGSTIMTGAAVAIELVAIEKLVPTPDNPRFIPHPEELAALTASIKSMGILQPLVARPHPKLAGKYDLRAGSRRLAAAKAAGLKTVPVNVLNLTDAEAMDVTVAENFHREDLHPLEEAKGVDVLLKSGWTLEDIATRYGRSPAWLCRRAALTKLAEPWAAAFVDPEQQPSTWPAGIMELIARLPESTQLTVFKASKERWGLEMPDRQGFKRWLEGDFIRTVPGMPWDTNDATLYPEAGSCRECTKRSDCSAQALLFVEDPPAGRKHEAKKDPPRCLDPVCYGEKDKRHLQVQIAAAKSEHPGLKLLHNDYYKRQELQRVLGVKVSDQYAFSGRGKQGDKNVVPVIDLATGKVDYRKQHATSPAPQKAAKPAKGGKAKPVPLKQLREELAERRAAWVSNEIRDTLVKLQKGKDASKKLKWNLNHVATLTAAFGSAIYNCDPGEGWKEYSEFKSGKRSVLEALTKGVLEIFDERTSYGRCEHEELQQMAPLLGVNLVALQKQSVAQFPEPAAWAKLNPDGTPQGVASGKSTKSPKTPAKKGDESLDAPKEA